MSELTASGGFSTPTGTAYPLIALCFSDPLPPVTVRRGGIQYADHKNWPERPKPLPLPAAPEGAGPGSWVFAIRDEEGGIYSTFSTYDQHDPYLRPEDAIEDWGHLDGATVIRRWVPDVVCEPWEDHTIDPYAGVEGTEPTA